MWTEKYYTECVYCCEREEGGSLCCCESTTHNPDSIENFLEQSTCDNKKVELIFRTEEDADQFYFHLNQANYKKLW